jgi:hypothetical protein
MGTRLLLSVTNHASLRFFLPLVVRMTAGSCDCLLKHKSLPFKAGFFLYFQFSSSGRDGMPNWRGFSRFGMCDLEDFLSGKGLTRRCSTSFSLFQLKSKGVCLAILLDKKWDSSSRDREIT